jgi:hypothetical protein
MSDRATFEAMSRRDALSLFGIASAFSLAVPGILVGISESEAETAGMERRQDRRTGRHERRETRRTGRHERRETRRTGGKQSETTGSK